MSQSIEIKGTLVVKGDTLSYGQRGFLKRKIVIQTLDQYPQKIPIDFVQDKSDLPDPYIEGEEVVVSVNFRGSEYNDEYYLSLQGWRIQRVPLSGGSQPAPAPAPNAPAPPAPEPEEDIDDLPF